MRGYIYRYLKDKKYGFIRSEDGESYFFILSSIVNRKDNNFEELDLVDFDPVESEKGPVAENINLILD